MTLCNRKTFAPYKKGQIQNHQNGGKNRYQVHQAPKAKHIFDAIGCKVQISQIIQCKESHSGDLYPIEQACIPAGKGLDGF